MKKIKSIKDKHIIANLNKNPYYSEEAMCRDLFEFAQCARDYRIICSVTNVRKKGTVRDIHVNAFDKVRGVGSVRNFSAMFRAMGYSAEYSSVAMYGCGMDMIFALIYNVLTVCANEGIITLSDRDNWSTRYTFVQ